MEKLEISANLYRIKPALSNSTIQDEVWSTFCGKPRIFFEKQKVLVNIQTIKQLHVSD
jgi:hypothetical protein